MHKHSLPVAVAVLLSLGVAACGSETPPTVSGPGGPGGSAAASATATPAGVGTTTQVDGFMDVINARIPAPPGGASQAELELTLADVSTAPSVLQAVRSPVARRVALTEKGRAVTHIPIPVSDGGGINFGPPSPDGILLTGLRQHPRLGADVAVSFVFGGNVTATLQVPVVAAP